MRIRLRDTTLFVDIEGLQLVPDGAAMRERRTLLLLHGGPGMDHSLFKPAFSALAEDAQLVYLDQRGHGRSDPAPAQQCRLAVWADDVRELCDALGIVRPVVLGVSFGGFVALSYAVRHPDHAGGLILSNTRAHTDLDNIAAAFARLGGPDAGACARAFWAGPSWESLSNYLSICAPLYMGVVSDRLRSARIRGNPELMLEWIGAEHPHYDLLSELQRIRCPTLVLAGSDDPICPIDDVERMVAALPPGRLTYRRFAAARHDLAGELGGVFVEEVRGFLRSLGD